MAKGFNRPTAGGGQAGMMQQIQRLQQQMAEAQEQLASETVSATAGGGAVKVTMSGDQKCQAVEIAPELLKECQAGSRFRTNAGQSFQSKNQVLDGVG